MDRKIIYPGQIPLETDILDTNRFAMIGIGKLAAAVLGTSMLVSGLACTPTAPASLQVQVAPGEIYSLQNLDGTAYSSLAADTTHQILKQGLMMDAVTLSCPAPSISGQSIAYLVQASYQDVDASPVTLPYYNASNPTQAYSGPNNSGSTQSTVRKGVCTVTLKAGTSSVTGSQTTPAADSGCVGLYVITVAYGQSTVAAGDITTASGAPILSETLTSKISQAACDARYMQLNATFLQPGDVTFSATSFAPTGYLKANGAVVSRTTYAALFAAIGTTFGAGNGSTTFNIPDMRGVFPRGLDDGRGVDPGRALGSLQNGTAVRVKSPYANNYVLMPTMARTDADPFVNSTRQEILLGTLPYGGTEGNSDSFGLMRPTNVALLACIKY